MGSDDDISGNNTAAVERQEISQLVKCRMSSLGLPLEDYNGQSLWLLVQLPSMYGTLWHLLWQRDTLS